MTLTDFLLARIAEDETVAREAVISAHDAPNAYKPHPELSRWRVRRDAEIEADYDDPGPHPEPLLIVQEGDFGGGVLDDTYAEHIARHDPARVLAECEAKRRIVDLHGGTYDSECQSPAHLDGPCRTLRAFALPHADHPEFREEWRP